jgi:hypothetical protein
MRIERQYRGVPSLGHSQQPDLTGRQENRARSVSGPGWSAPSTLASQSLLVHSVLTLMVQTCLIKERAGRLAKP